MKKLGWKKSGHNFTFIWLVNQKLAHLIVILLSVVVVSLNFTSKTQAVSLEELVGETFLSELVSNDLSEVDELVEEYFDKEEIISPVQQIYLENLAAIKIQPQVLIEETDELGEIEETTGLMQGGSAIVRPEIAATTKIKRDRDKVVDYIVQPGDSVSTIAAEFEISVNTILWENNLSAYSLIRPGDKLAILPTTGIIHKVESGETISKISSQYNIEEVKILEANRMSSEDKLSINQQIIIPGGKKVYYSSAAAESYTGLSVIRNLVSPPSAKPIQGNKMNWPTEGHAITQYYSWRHYAVDIANKMGTPIYAADAGTVEYAGWGKGYGNQIVIDHGGGKKTRYAHNSELYVERGQGVDKGEVIAAMGSTGWSTGPHVHFEVIINGKKYNPLNYIK